MALWVNTEGGTPSNPAIYAEFQGWVNGPLSPSYLTAYYFQPHYTQNTGGPCYARIAIVNFDTSQSQVVAWFDEGTSSGLDHHRFDFSWPSWPTPYRYRFSFLILDNDLNDGFGCRASVTYDDPLQKLGFVTTPVETTAPASTLNRLSRPYPNPTQGPTRFELTLDRPEEVRVAVYDPLGREVEVVQDGLMPTGSTSLSLSTTSFRAGVYVIRATGEGGWTEIQRFTRQE